VGSEMCIRDRGSTDMLPAALPALGTDWPVYSLNIFGLLPAEGPLPDVSVPVVARRFVEKMRAAQPKGPYLLGGYCRDALVAFEMARQLHQAGERVLGILMVDVFWGAPQQYSQLRRHLRNFREFGPEYVTDKIRRRRKWLHEKTQRLLSRRAVQAVASEEELPQQYRNALYINKFYDECDAYQPAPYAGEVTVIMASEWGVERVPDLERVCQRVHLREVRAYHQNLWIGAQAEALGRAMRSALEEASASR